jgi:hypothetical protein
MATPALKDVSKKDLAEQYHRLLMRTKKANTVAKREGEALVRDVVTLGSAAGFAFFMGTRARDAIANGTDVEESQQMGGIDLDLIVGGASAVSGLAGWGGKMSESLRAVGVGVLSGYAGRRIYARGMEPKE